ncbi:MAG: mercuric reductase [Gemmatimonadales bacterium]
MHADTIIIGSGQAGAPLAARLAEAGQRVVLFEKAHLGGTCVNVGCTPTKTMIASARAAHVARGAARLGVRTGRVSVDLGAVVDRKREIVEQWRDGVQRRLDRAGDRLTLIRAEARFTGPRKVIADGRDYTADRVIINAGCRPVTPAVPGLDTVAWLDNARAMELREVPKHLIVLGGGYIGCELGQMFRRFGTKVTIVDHNDHLLSREDPDLSLALEEALRGEGMDLRLGTDVKQIEGADGRITVIPKHGRRIRGTHLLVATGRRSNADSLNCEAAGIALDARGFIKTDDNYRTSAEGVYAVGDVTGGPQFTHSSWDDHRILFDQLMHGASRNRRDRLIPYAVFTDPPLARVGLSEKEAKSRGVPHEVARMPFGSIARAVETGETAGLLKVLLDPESGRILGASIVGLEAAELIHVFVVMIEAGAPAQALVDAEMIHPALSEGLQSVIMTLDRYKLK